MTRNFFLSDKQGKYAIAVALTMVTVVISFLFWPILERAPFLVPMAAVALSAWLGGLRPGMLTAALSIVSIDYFLITPVHRVLTDPIEALQLVIFGLVALLISGLDENRRQSAQSVRELSKELAFILNSVSDGITTQDDDGNVIFANPAAANMLGFETVQDVIQSDMQSIRGRYDILDQDGEKLPDWSLPRNQVFSTGKSASITFKLRFRDTGREKWLNITASPVFDADGKVRQVVNVLRDISEQIQVQFDREHLAAIVQNSDDAIVGKDLDANINSWNPGAERLYGYTAQEAIGQSIAILFPDDLKPRELTLHQRILRGEHIAHYETERVHKDGRRLHISLTISPIRNTKGEIVGFSTIERDITARKQREAKIKQLNELAGEQHRRLETIISSIPGIVYVSSGDNDIGWQRMDYISPYAETLLGYSADNWEGQDVAGFWKDIVHPDDWEQAIAKVNQLYDADTPGSIQFRCITAAGQTIHVEAHNAILRNEDGMRTGTCGVVMDITEREKSRERLVKLTQLTEEQRRHITNVVSNVPGIVYDGTVDVETGSQEMTFISDYTKTMLGYDPIEWTKDPYFWRKIIPEEDWKDASQKAKLALEKGVPGIAQYRCIRADGTTIYVESFFQFQENEGVLKSYGVIMDITERKQREEEINRLNRQLRIQKRRMDNIIANVPGIVYEMEIDPHNQSQRINYLSPYAETMLGYSTEEMLEMENVFHHVVHPDDTEDFLNQSKVANSDETRSYQYRFWTKDKDLLHVETYSRVIEDEPGVPIGAVGVVMDISHRKRIEAELEANMEDLTRSNQDLEQFAYVASHDLQEPLRKISSYLQLIEQRYSDSLDEDGKDFIHFAVDGAVRMRTLINDLLMYSRVQRNKEEFRRIQLQTVLNTVLENLQLAIEENEAEIVCDELPEVFASNTQMIQLFQNLLSNALKYRSEETPKVSIGAEKKGSYWQFYVKDNGIGIDPKYFERVFMIFQRLHGRREYSGTGIGLAVCKKIIENHDGQIWLDSSPGEGTTFFFTLSA